MLVSRVQKLVTTISIGIAIIVLAIFGIIPLLFRAESQDLIYDSVDEVPTRDAALLLGTSKYSRYGSINSFYSARIRAAATLYHAKKVELILVSGDNRHNSYNEPARMKQSLVSFGVSPEHIKSDYAGIRTFDSVLRAQRIYGLNNYTIVSQLAHVRRAIYIAHRHDQQVIGFSSATPGGIHAFHFQLREAFARVKAILDIYVLGTEPQFAY